MIEKLMTAHPAQPPHHPRLRPRGLQRGGVRRARQSRAAADHRRRAGRPAHDHHRRRQLARGRRRPAGPGADGAHEAPRRALRHRDRQRSRAVGGSAVRPLQAQRRRAQLQLRCAHHRHRRQPRTTSACLRRSASAAAACRRAPPATASSSAASASPWSAAATPRSRKRCTCRTLRTTSRSCTAATSCARRRSCRSGCSAKWHAGKIAVRLEPHRR